MQGTGHAISDAVRSRPEIELEGYPTLFRDLFVTFRSRGVSREESQDLAQETILRTLVHLRRHGRSADDLGPLVRTIGRNLFIERIRRARPEVVELSDTIVDDTPEPVEVVVESERREEIRAALQSLTPRHRHVVTLWMQGLTPGQIAGQLGIKRNAADAILHRARRRLASLLEESRGALGVIALAGPRLRAGMRRIAQTIGVIDPSGSLGAVAGGLAAVGIAVVMTASIPGTSGSSSASREGGATRGIVQRVSSTRSLAPTAAGASAASSRARADSPEARTEVVASLQDQHVKAKTSARNPATGEEEPLGIEGWQERDSENPGTVGPLLDRGAGALCAPHSSVCSARSEW